MSCDIEPTANPGPHIQDDVRKYLQLPWLAVIAFPPCTHLAVSGGRYFAKKRADGRQQQAIDFFMDCVNANSNYVAVENPVGIMSTVYQKPTQYIQPWQFGYPTTKKTGLWLKGFPPLVPDVKEQPQIEYITTRNGVRFSKWYYETELSGKKNRAKMRSLTFQGIANAMAAQWSPIIQQS